MAFVASQVVPADSVVQALCLYPGVVATVSGDREADCVHLSITDDIGTSFTVQIPSQAASDLAVALVNAANGM